MVIIFAFVSCFIIVATQLYQLIRFLRVLKTETTNNNKLTYKEAPLLWYISQGLFMSFAIMMIFISNDDIYGRSIFIILSGFFFANLILGITFKRIYYNDLGFLYQQRFIPFTDFISVEPVGRSKKTYQINTKSEILFMEKRRALFIEDIYNTHQKKAI